MKPVTNDNEIRFLLDENISPNIAPQLWEAGIDALPVRDRAMRGSSDHKVFEFAQNERRAVATINEYDFSKLARAKQSHCGIAVIPNGGTREEQLAYLATIANTMRSAPDAMDAIRDRILTIDEQMQMAIRVVRAPRSLPISAVGTATLKPIA